MRAPIEDIPPRPAIAERETDRFSASISALTSELADEPPQSAPIRYPARDRIAVQLVNVELLRRLDDGREDVTLCMAVFFGVLGGLLGLLPAVIEKTPTGMSVNLLWVGVSAGLLAFWVVAGVFWLRAAKRADKIRRSVFSGQGEAP
jgi:hypothetical protein